MSYDLIDSKIQAWATKQSLRLVTSFAGKQVRAAYVSSKAGECFQIWIDRPVDARIGVHAICVEGRRENEAPEDWESAATELEAALDDAFQAVLGWMAPSERFLPEPRH